MITMEANEILGVFNTLPDEQKKEVYDFMRFLKSEVVIEKDRKKGKIGMVYGSAKGSKLTTDLFSKMKAEDIAME